MDTQALGARVRRYAGDMDAQAPDARTGNGTCVGPSVGDMDAPACDACTGSIPARGISPAFG
jgi:hypothetical protein